MTMHCIVSVLDLATETYGRPFVVHHPRQAVRSFTDEVNNPESEIARHAEDYELYQLGTFDDATGQLEAGPLRLVRAIDLKKGA